MKITFGKNASFYFVIYVVVATLRCFQSVVYLKPQHDRYVCYRNFCNKQLMKDLQLPVAK